MVFRCVEYPDVVIYLKTSGVVIWGPAQTLVVNYWPMTFDKLGQERAVLSTRSSTVELHVNGKRK